jgi:transcriptional regulator with XRE-family HTH domain
LSQSQLAAAIGVSGRTVQSYEKGKSYPKQREIYSKLAALFGVRRDYLLSESEDIGVLSNGQQTGSCSGMNMQMLINELTDLFSSGEMTESEMDAFMYSVMKAYVEATEKTKNPFKMDFLGA